ncbi:hypothetical protein DSLASN_21400 [Desulfoluna limicola]|uniref:Porin n=1 Tax=Desulfoluna limicola TaxID=2810562 RepID=A0ABM7PG09_9BACT|nr:hypothetical protein [Desulfoluna limicola]BCS96508.1 hypothetical protein DSLASN_21400 [Desulfoluna limicola]
MMKRMAILLAGFLIFLSAQAAGAYELGSTGNINIHGFISQGYLQTTDNNFFGPTEDGSFQFNERGINFSADVSDRLRVGLQFFSRDFGSLGDNEVTIDWAFADYTLTEWANFKAGKIKMPQGLYNTTRDVDMLRTSILLPQSVYNEGWRDSINAMDGFEFYGYAPAGVVGSFEYHTQIGVNKFKDDGPEMRLLEDQFPVAWGVDVDNNHVDRTYVGSFIWEAPLEGLRMGASGWQMSFDADITGYSPVTSQPDSDIIDVTQTGWTTSLEYSIGDLVLSTEYNRINYEFDAPKFIPGGMDFDSEGYYGMATYRFCDWFEMGTYYSEYYSNTDDKDGKDAVAKWNAYGGMAGGYPPGQEHRAYLKDLALSLRFDITENWILKVEGHQMKGAAIMLNSDGNTAVYSGVMGPAYEKDWQLYTAKVSFSF